MTFTAIPNVRAGLTILTLTALVAFAAATAGHAQVTLLSENFDASGNPYTPSATAIGASTDYSLTTQGAFTAPGQYRIITNPSTAFTNGYTSYGDHTSGTGQFLFVDGAGSSSTRLWDDTLTLTAGTTYTFSFWGSSGGATAVPVLHPTIDGASLATGSDLTTVNGVWTQFTGTFTVATTGSHTLAIVDTMTPSSGNDGGIDDIRLTAPSAAPEPSDLLLLVPAVAGFALTAQRQRRRQRK